MGKVLVAGVIVRVRSGFEGILDPFKRYRLTHKDKYGNAQVTDANNAKAPYIETHITQIEKV